VLFIDARLSNYGLLRSIGEVDPFKLKLSRNKLLARVLQDLHAMLFAKWIATPPKNLSILKFDIARLIYSNRAVSYSMIEHSVVLEEYFI